MGSSPTSLDKEIDQSVNCGLTPDAKQPVITYRLPSGASDPNFGWVPSGNDYVAKMRATMGNGDICGYDSPLIPQKVFNDIIKTSKNKQGQSYKVTVTMKTGEDLSLYFN